VLVAVLEKREHVIYRPRDHERMQPSSISDDSREGFGQYFAVRERGLGISQN